MIFLKKKKKNLIQFPIKGIYSIKEKRSVERFTTLSHAHMTKFTG